MNSKILINAVDPEECRIAKIVDNKLEDFHTETSAKLITQGNIYKGTITHVEQSLHAVFVDYGADRHGFLQKQEIHSDYFQDSHSGDRSLPQIIKRGQEVLVQITKDPAGSKGAMLTTFISLPGRYVVLMPGSENQGISRKIHSEKERKRLKTLIEGLKVPEGYGLILRTVGENATKTDIYKDFRYLMRLWKNIQNKVSKHPTPSLLYKERNIFLRSIRDHLTPNVSEILIDDVNVYQEVKDFVYIISPKQSKIVKQHKGDKPIFSRYQLEEQIASIFESRVNLKSGGSIVINQTEALVAIDVNSGKATQKNSIEQTALQTNIEAAEEIARQLRLRDLGGLIVIDFIDMRESKNKGQVESELRSFLKEDKARTKTGKITQFGLLEMSRQRIKPSIEFGSYVVCSHCKGKGLVPSTETLGLRFLRKLSLKTLKGNLSKVRGIVPPSVAFYLLNRKRNEILDMESRKNLQIFIESDHDLMPGEDKIIFDTVDQT
ncbi:MAG: Rne/Rng family ribonuclease [Proteobacteria bacterium]|nr:Rne/Rng family ribonuclease [Pseudomonadota bacterium]